MMIYRGDQSPSSKTNLICRAVYCLHFQMKRTGRPLKSASSMLMSIINREAPRSQSSTPVAANVTPSPSQTVPLGSAGFPSAAATAAPVCPLLMPISLYIHRHHATPLPAASLSSSREDRMIQWSPFVVSVAFMSYCWDQAQHCSSPGIKRPSSMLPMDHPSSAYAASDVPGDAQRSSLHHQEQIGQLNPPQCPDELGPRPSPRRRLSIEDELQVISPQRELMHFFLMKL